VIPYRYCPHCAAELSTRRIPANDGPERRVCSVCGFIQWGNSKASSSGIVVDSQGRILLSLRACEPFLGCWDIPGGFLESWEHPEDGVRRELREETGLQVEVVGLVGVYMDTYGPPPSDDTLNFYYECRVTEGRMRAEDDVERLDWFDPRHLPGPLAFANAQRAFEDWRARR
jgi:ADP-ribose pyrophosphatase YjhB (NUDIX family)